MTNRTVINGKVMRTPTLSRYDNMVAKPEPVILAAVTGEFNQQFVKDAGRTWERDKAELVALGVNGEFDFGTAVVNAGLDLIGNTGGVKHAWRSATPANDNHKITAVAA